MSPLFDQSADCCLHCTCPSVRIKQTWTFAGIRLRSLFSKTFGVKGHSLRLPARRDEWIALRCVAFHEWVCLGRFGTIEAFLKTFKCRRTAIKRHPQRGTLGVHLKVICRSKP